MQDLWEFRQGILETLLTSQRGERDRQTVNNSYLLLCGILLGLALFIIRKEACNVLFGPNPKDAVIRYDTKKSSYYRVGYDSANHVYYREKLSVRNWENNVPAFRIRFFRQTGSSLFQNTKSLAERMKRTGRKTKPLQACGEIA